MTIAQLHKSDDNFNQFDKTIEHNLEYVTYLMGLYEMTYTETLELVKLSAEFGKL